MIDKKRAKNRMKCREQIIKACKIQETPNNQHRHTS